MVEKNADWKISLNFGYHKGREEAVVYDRKFSNRYGSLNVQS